MPRVPDHQQQSNLNVPSEAKRILAFLELLSSEYQVAEMCFKKKKVGHVKKMGVDEKFKTTYRNICLTFF